ncbi:hypothetical protein P4O66_007310 [Electrophorus voltai]|uniref:Protein phosphatase 1, regulatory subunit 27b n=1 Tax=Electrophorus voltai TaxID=2609070 RepID=A0AAD8ZIF7_9TELE|nr:hypothetical protein P4O66_007310 [Electrophorus voltai]
MKFGYQSPVLRYTRHGAYTPTHYTPSLYSTKQYSTNSYSTSHYGSVTYMPAYTPPAYTPAYKSLSTCTPTYRSLSAYTTSDSKPRRQNRSHSSPAPHTCATAIKPSRSVRFTNDVVFLDHVRHGDLEMIGRFMRARKVRVDTIFHSGMAALHEAVLSGNLECVKLLIKYGADVHQRDENGWTPLHMACSDGYPEIARYLLSLGASVEAENENREKPADLIDPSCKELVNLFEVGCV